MCSEVRKRGTLLNQIAKKINQAGYCHQPLNIALEDYEEEKAILHLINEQLMSLTADS